MYMKRIGRSIVPVLMFAMVASTSSPASAHTEAFPTSLTISVSPAPPVSPGTEMTFSGRLKSDRDACKKASTVNLVKVGVGTVSTTTTDNRGRYSFSKKVRATNRWKVRFSGKVLNAVHPHNHTCEASSSESIRVRVV